MLNDEIAAMFIELADLLELSRENPFKIRAYRKAAKVIDELQRPIRDMSSEEISALPGIGKAISDKIQSALKTGTFSTLEKWRRAPYADFRPLSRQDGLSIKTIRGLIEDFDLKSVKDFKKLVDKQGLDLYKKISKRAKGQIRNFLSSDYAGS